MRFATILILSTIVLSNSCHKSTGPQIHTGSWSIVREQQDDNYYSSIHFVDANNGWIVGGEGTIEHTSDGGYTWESQTSGVTSHLIEVDFVDSQTGWVCGEKSTVLKTTDGGDSWVDIAPTDTVEKIYHDIDFISTDVGWMSNNYGDALKTVDGGLTWEVKWSYEKMGGSPLSVIDANTIYVLHGMLYRTFDGGSTWDSLSVPAPGYYRAERIFFTDRDNGWANTFFASGGLMSTYNAVVSTKDGGLTWKLSEALNDDYFTHSYFVDANIGWVTGPHKIYKTVDGGDHWSLEASDDYPLYGLKDMMFVDENHGWILNWQDDILRYLGSEY